MTKEQRTAMARIISDMIKADNIIEESEIEDMKKLMSGYTIPCRQEVSSTPVGNVAALTALFCHFCMAMLPY